MLPKKISLKEKEGHKGRREMEKRHESCRKQMANWQMQIQP